MPMQKLNLINCCLATNITIGNKFYECYKIYYGDLQVYNMTVFTGNRYLLMTNRITVFVTTRVLILVRHCLGGFYVI
jgi:hypothetical protein